MDSNIKLSQASPSPAIKANKALNFSVQFWFILAVIGQWIFAFTVAYFYGSTAVMGKMEAWQTQMYNGYVAGEQLGNFVVAIHLLMAVIVLIGGPLQLTPAVRKKAPKFHRWNGRVYIITAFLISLTGLIMLWTRGTVGGLVQHLSTSFNGILIMYCAVKAWQYAMARNFKTHREWAIRLFLVMSGVWFFRVGLMLWMMIFQAPVGFDYETFEGPFLIFLNLAQFIIPLLIFEWYLMAKKGSNTKTKWSMAISLFVMSLLMGMGIFGATMGMWYPLLAN